MKRSYGEGEGESFGGRFVSYYAPINFAMYFKDLSP